MTLIPDLESMKYSELQKLAKGAGIKANQKIEKLIKALKQHYNEASAVEEVKITGVKEASAAPQKSNKSTPKSEDVSQSQNRSLDSGNGGRKRRRTFELDEPTLSSSSTPNAETTGTKRDTQRSSKSNTNTPNSDTKVSPFKKRPRRGTFDKESPSLSSLNGSGQRSTRQRSSKTNTPTAVDDAVTSPKKRVRRGTYDKDSPAPEGVAPSLRHCSPGTQAMLQSMDPSASDMDMKSSLLSALDKKVQEKVSSGQTSDSQAPSQIPRFMAFLAQKKKAQKPVTPGNKDWTKIHNKAFSKFESIDVYLEKKQQRKEKLTNSAKKGIPSSPLKKGPTIAKPVSKPAAQIKPFVPTVTSTKNLTFNFGKTPTALSAKTPTKAAVSVKKTLNTTTGGPAKTPKSAALSARKSVGSVKRETPYIFTGNTSSLNTTANSNKKTFDLKASLARPLNYKPHTGKLQPLDPNKSGGAYIMKTRSIPKPVSGVKPSRQVMASKSRQAMVKDVHRAQQLDRRHNQKYIDMMKRRGLMA